ncbi:MAG: PEP-CTERM sorting domain-containing protein [Phycisphaerae bacterium]|nr:PEP-CTERM sorting domain-containing protein [Phycisphaerae bacterium]
MKFRLLSILVICLMVSGAYASVYPLASGNWSDATNWSKGVVPPDDGDEIKLVGSQSDETGQDYVITVNTNVGMYTTTKIDTARGSELLVTGGYIGNGREMHIGDAGASGNGSDDGFLTITGGTVDVTGKLQIGYKAHAVDNVITGARGGLVSISGGSLIGTTGRIYVACSSADGSVGKLSVTGSDATISMGGTMYIANDSSSASGNTGEGTLEFNLVDGAVSKIQVDSTVIDSQAEEAAVANLLVNLTSGLQQTVTILVQNTGASAVVGVFDNITLGAGVKGYIVYDYNAEAMEEGTGNDIALIIPEPATIALLSLGLFIIRRKK